MRLSTDPCRKFPTPDPADLPASADGFFMGYPNTTKVVLYFDPESWKVKRTFHCIVDEFDIKLHPEESISLGTLMLQEYPSGVLNLCSKSAS